MTRGFSSGGLSLCSVCRTRICHPVTGICLTCKLDEVGEELGRRHVPQVRANWSHIPGDTVAIVNHEEVRHHIGWWGKPRIRIPRFLAGWLERFNCVFTEYVDCRVVEEAVVDVNKSPSEIASEIADDFYPTASLQHADLRRRIMEAIETERTAQAVGNPHQGTVDTSEPATYQGPPRIKD